ncbi:Interferon-induced very large GTPase 1 [Channa argus]|uniref:Interferon-induced very large GTPase 1 n=1 Tax=Channa argus TaxID=215402 RepID=A0A6G1Q5R1_CHAAH|nr:Interferon-induced very large GTPase 1 [Channa argus]
MAHIAHKAIHPAASYFHQPLPNAIKVQTVNRRWGCQTPTRSGELGETDKRTKEDIICHNCSGVGHLQRNYPCPRRSKQQTMHQLPHHSMRLCQQSQTQWSLALRLSRMRPLCPHVKKTVYNISSESVPTHLQTPAGEVGNYIVTYCREGEIVHQTMDLRPDVQNSRQNSEETKSENMKTSANTKTRMQSFLEDLGLKQNYTEKLSLSSILQIDEKIIIDEPARCNSDLPWYFLKKLMMVNVTARNVKWTSVCESNCDVTSEITELDFDDLFDSSNSGDINPLDLITALFLCSDGFVQQEMSLKMSMCQFSVPLLLPNCDTPQCTLMLWAMRDIVKKYRPQSLSESKGFMEDRIVLSELPMISFVRLGECSLSKSEILNKLLSNSQQYHDTFVHRNMECGESPRRISNGLTEITWYLPCGNKNMDVFSEPVAVANLRGDIASFETQYSFLCQTSAAVFVFFDKLESDFKLLNNQHHKAQIFLVGNYESKQINLDVLKKVATNLSLNKKNIIIKTKDKNNADFVKKLKETVSDVVENTRMKMGIEQMAEIAHELGILVDEKSTECQTAKDNADNITVKIQDIPKYKEAELPLQGQLWKELTNLEKEEFRLRKVGSQNIETNKSDLQIQKEKLWDKQNSYDMSDAMTCFINAISSPGIERCYFLKWMRMNLDNLSREKLSGLREQYKKKCNNSENKEEIKDIDRQLSNSSLGTEHFFREMGQIYEASLSLPETNQSRQQLQHLPKLCAGLMLDGFPLELVDGDASNIPLRWVSDVLSQLNELVSPKNKILVVTVLGVQSTGKSTLLNTMFGVQFAVSSGRCTRGAFMLLLKINDDIKKVLNCDFVVIIDTEGLKSPELAQLDDSHEHDNELATLVVGLSDITIINVAMENSTEMNDILQIVVHAFLRMKEVGKKPKCQFVHQNVSDVSAHEKNLRDRKLLLQQLNEMTQAAAKMEKKVDYKSFTDVMEYNPDTGNWYIPGLWNGNPPMAPVNAGYSEAVYELKKNIIQLLGNCESSANNVMEFTEWMKSLWNAVKHENFIFSFRNSLVADAYMRLCTEFNKWEWEFKKDMYTWVTRAETRISNFGTVAAKSIKSDIGKLLTCLKTEASTLLAEWETKLLKNLTDYFKQTEGHVYLVEGYREEFSNSAKSIRREMENSVFNQLTAAAEIKQGMREVEQIKENHTKEMVKAVCALIDECRKKKVQMTEEELDKEFDKMWNETVRKLSVSKLKPTDVFTCVSHYLRQNLSHKGSHACELLSKKSLKACGLKPFKYTAEGYYNQAKHKISKWLNLPDHTMMVQKLADSILDACKQFVTEKMERKTNYHDTYIQEIVLMIDERLENNQDLGTDIKFEVSLKLHICGFAARNFQQMHEDFLQCQKKAEEFTNQCLKPAVEDFINCSLGPDIIGEMLTLQQFSTRMWFQYSLLQDLLENDTFENYLSYISSYEDYVKKQILDQILSHFSDGSKMSDFEDQHIQSCINSITDGVNEAKLISDNLKTFVKDICRKLGEKLVISQDALGAFMILNKADQEQFAYWLTVSVKDMAQTLREEFKKSNIEKKLNHLRVKPQNELFTKLIGCGKQCPFCTAPCEAGGKAHTVHWASLHRPEGLGRYRWHKSRQLVTDICSSLVISNARFCCNDTNNKWHPYKQYEKIFPDWKIAPDISLHASDYWKYVMAKFNSNFAQKYSAQPAEIPPTWKDITKEQASASLKESFNIK